MEGLSYLRNHGNFLPTKLPFLLLPIVRRNRRDGRIVRLIAPRVLRAALDDDLARLQFHFLRVEHQNDLAFERIAIDYAVAASRDQRVNRADAATDRRRYRRWWR